MFSASKGIVTSLVEWGAFVELERSGWCRAPPIERLRDKLQGLHVGDSWSGRSGLIHISEADVLSMVEHGDAPLNVQSSRQLPGQLSDVFVDNIEDYIQPGQRVEASTQRGYRILVSVAISRPY